ncbi:MAG: YceI family protein [Campylobacter sp.]|nr:YceI family protein [Campylobacter sp.]
MKKILLACILMINFALADWSYFKVDKEYTKIGFTVKHMGIANINGSFKDSQISIKFNETDKTPHSIEVIVEPKSINTNNIARDRNLTTQTFFHVKKHKSISFKMTKFEDNKVYGILKMGGVSKEVVFNYTYNGVITTRESETPIHGFSLNSSIKRLDFNIGKDYPTDLVGDNVRLSIDIEGTLYK